MNKNIKKGNKKNSLNNMKLFLGIYEHINKKRRKQLIVLLFVMIFSGFSEMVSLVAVGPFIAVIANPEKLLLNPFLSKFTFLFGINSSEDLLLPLTMFFLITIFVAGIIRIFNLYLNTRLASAIGTDISYKVFKLTLSQPFETHLNQNSSKILTALSTEIYYTILAINFALTLITTLVVSISIITALLFINYLATLATIFILGIAYLLIALKSKNRLYILSESIELDNIRLTKLLQESLGSVREIFLANKVQFFADFYFKIDYQARRNLAKTQFISGFPRYAIESIALFFMGISAYLLSKDIDNNLSTLSMLGAFALGSLRLLPSIQSAYGCWAWIGAQSASISRIIGLLNQNLPYYSKKQKSNFKFLFKNKIVLKNLSYSYANHSRKVLKNINLNLNKGDCLAIIGETGSGKSTLIDILLGLLPPKSGCFLVDKIDLHEESNYNYLLSWRKQIAVVPQRIFLFDNSIEQNIAFGIESNKIDKKRIKEAAKLAQISEFIDSTEDKYNTFIGERGIRLSGGQAQRIGIARAIYNNKKILIFDEATSSLDTETEKKVMDSIKSFRKDITIIIVAHRLSTLNICNRLIKISNGEIIYDGEPKSILNELNSTNLK